MTASTIEHAGPSAKNLTVSDRDGKVVLKFDQAVQWAALEPDVACGLAKQLIDASEACGARVTIQIPKPKMPAFIRERAVNRVTIMMNSKRDTAENNHTFATRIVDTILNLVEM